MLDDNREMSRYHLSITLRTQWSCDASDSDAPLYWWCSSWHV